MATSFKKFTAIFLVAVFFFYFASGPARGAQDVKAQQENQKLEIAVTHPWLALLASFIGGVEVNVIPVKIWNSNGDLIMNERGKILKELPAGSKIIALDEQEAASSGIKANEKNKFQIHYLYSPFPVSINLLLDPSVIPFVAQRVLTALSEWDAPNYPYYQRRLAEFQARLSGSVLVGQVLKSVTICNMGGSCGILLQAAGCKLETLPQELDEWKKGNYLSSLGDFIESKRAAGIITVFDDDTPPALKKFLASRKDTFKWERPSFERDYPSFLHEQYISLWQKITAKPLK